MSSGLPGRPASADQNAKLWVDPSGQVGQGTFTVRIMQHSDIATTGAQVNLSFDRSLLHEVDVTRGAAYANGSLYIGIAPQSRQDAIAEANTTTGMLWDAAAYLGQGEGFVAAGDAEALVITMTPVATNGVSMLTISTPKMIDSNREDIEGITTVNGRVAVGDADNDGFAGTADNCPFDANANQANTDSGPPPPSGNTGRIDNDQTVNTPLADDGTVPNGDGTGDTCDADKDNDGLLDSQDTEPLGATGVCAAFSGSSDGHGSPSGGDITDDDNGNGNPSGLVGSDAADNGPSWDTDSDGVLDGVECVLGTNPRDRSLKPSAAACGGATDVDQDGLPASAEYCKWGTSDTVLDSDGDGKSDCVEANDTTGDGVQNFPGDALDHAKAANGVIPKTLDYDLNGDGIVNFPGDGILSAKMANHVIDAGHPNGYCP